MDPVDKISTAVKEIVTHIADKVFEVQEKQRQFQREERLALHAHEKQMQVNKLKTAAAASGRTVIPAR